MSRKTVRLGYEVGTGFEVDIPLNHMVVTGQTQMAGKTTTLEALIARARVKAIAFVTKRGEGAFAAARIVPPYFREQADWQFVASILEASRGEKLKFERSWIMRASKGAHTLADVQTNVRRLMGNSKRSMDADMYMVLDAYLDVVVPQIEAVEWAKRVELASGLNVMDLTALNVEMQHLVIRSTIDWVLNHESNTVVVVPEAWKFIPQGRGTPVKLAAEAYIRQAAGLGNFLWLDSQDIAGVEKIILKSVPVWILGVQRESNEIKRTLAQIPAGIKKPKPEQIATLKLGQFFACYEEHTTKVYVQPAWMDDEQTAIGIAMGAKAPAPPTRTITTEDKVNESEARELRETNARLARENADLKRRLDEIDNRNAGIGAVAASLAPKRAPAKTGYTPSAQREDVADIDAARAAIDENGRVDWSDVKEDLLFDRFKARIMAEDPTPLLRLVQSRPELEVSVQRKTVTIDGTTLKGRVVQLLASGFFASGQRPGSVRAELARIGKDVNPKSLQAVLVDLVVDGFLTNEGSGRYKSVPEAVVRIIEN